MRTTGRARRGTRATTACRWRQRVVPRDAGHRGQRVLSRLSGRERGTFASRLGQFAITRVAVPRRANGPDPEPPLGAHEHESRGDRREHPLCRDEVRPHQRAGIDTVRRGRGRRPWPGTSGRHPVTSTVMSADCDRDHARCVLADRPFGGQHVTVRSRSRLKRPTSGRTPSRRYAAAP